MRARIVGALSRLKGRRAQREDRAGEGASGGGGQSMVSLRILHAFAGAYPQATFLEIGANDGKRFDPLAGFVADGAWSGLMIEPVPYVFERLEENFRDNDRVAVANVAIADRSGTRSFYFVAEQVDDSQGVAIGWYDTIGSFDRDHLFKHAALIPNLEQRIERIEVPCRTIEQVCADHGIDNPDLVMIDVEGFDAEVVSSIDFHRIRPRLLIYEHHHLSAETRSECETRLRDLGYGLLEDGLDTWCLDLRIDDDLAARWNRIEAS